MNLNTYDLIVPGYEKKINVLTNNLLNRFKNAIESNASDLSELVYRDSFDFITKSGEIKEVVEGNYIPVGKYQNIGIYVSLIHKKLIFFEKNTDTGLTYPKIIPDENLQLMFRDIDLFEDIMHVVGLSGILERSIEQKGQQLKILNEYLND